MTLVWLPDLCLIRIFSYLPPQDLCQLEQIHHRFRPLQLIICRRFRKLIVSTEPWFSDLDHDRQLIVSRTNLWQMVADHQAIEDTTIPILIQNHSKWITSNRPSNIAIELCRFNPNLFNKVRTLYLIIGENDLELQCKAIFNLLQNYASKLHDLRVMLHGGQSSNLENNRSRRMHVERLQLVPLFDSLNSMIALERLALHISAEFDVDVHNFPMLSVLLQLHTFEYHRYESFDGDCIRDGGGPNLFEQILLFNIRLFGQYNVSRNFKLNRIMFCSKIPFHPSISDLDHSVCERIAVLDLCNSLRVIDFGNNRFSALTKLGIEITADQYARYIRTFAELPRLMFLQLHFYGILSGPFAVADNDIPPLLGVIVLEISFRSSTHSVINSLQIGNIFPSIQTLGIDQRGSTCSLCRYSPRTIEQRRQQQQNDKEIEYFIFTCLSVALKDSLMKITVEGEAKIKCEKLSNICISCRKSTRLIELSPNQLISFAYNV